MEKLDAVIQDAKALLKSARSHAAGDDTPGIGAGLIDNLTAAIERAAAADLTQRNAMRGTGRLTETQDKALKAARDQIRKVRYAGKACYKRAEKQALKEFRVGRDLPTTVKGALGDLAYLRSVAEKRIGDLKEAGFRAADLAAVDSAHRVLEAADVSQELAKKTQKEATRARDDSYRGLKEAARQVRNAAKSVFIGQRAVLVEFESTVRAKPARGKAKSKLTVEKSSKTVTAV
jgi:ElaB/YqjD/DUF883 family membrane-anchored ribosome-binding protein